MPRGEEERERWEKGKKREEEVGKDGKIGEARGDMHTQQPPPYLVQASRQKRQL